MSVFINKVLMRLRRPVRVAAIAGVLTALGCAAAATDGTPGVKVDAQIERLADLPMPVAGGGLLRLRDGGLIYAGGTTWIDGEKRWLTETYRYDSADDRWEASTPLPGPFDAAVPLSLDVGGRWIMLGGETDEGVGNRGVALVDSGGAVSWEPVSPLPFGKAAATGGVIDGTLIVVGGADDHDSYAAGRTTVWLGRTQAEEPLNWHWKQADDFPGLAHSVAAGTVYGGRLYVFGGLYADEDGVAQNTDQAWSFSPTEGWRSLAPIPRACRGATAVAVQGVGIVLAGGWGDHGAFGDVYLYRVQRDGYDKLGTLPIPVAVMSGVSVGSDVYLAGNEAEARGRGPDVFRIRLNVSVEE